MSIEKHDWSETRVRVRYAETDQAGVVYHSNYLIWFEVGRVELCRDYGFNYRDMETSADAYSVWCKVDLGMNHGAGWIPAVRAMSRMSSSRRSPGPASTQMRRPVTLRRLARSAMAATAAGLWP